MMFNSADVGVPVLLRPFHEMNETRNSYYLPRVYHQGEITF
ncbi:hypothetical protein GCM10010435_40450 [Winogradskya consettensis]|uniref:Uncharacterized protein n=1 Tax=Winogradskya consettensis TaxID=113560 RepID=A0A919SDF7_9ACTN|nr:hypothetical protein [Actinoplanes consettensis]GIM69709.1 hypothetical protein Aco04nite_16580 [Actinoplanes consettensis]